MSFDTENEIFTVVKNHQDQHSIWPIWKDIPLGWQQVGKQGDKTQCLTYINEHWTDMAPRSLKQEIAAKAKNPMN